MEKQEETPSPVTIRLRDVTNVVGNLRSFGKTFSYISTLFHLIVETCKPIQVTVYLFTIVVIAILPTFTSLFTKLQLDLIAYSVGFNTTQEPLYFNSSHGWNMKDIQQCFQAVIILQSIAFALNKLQTNVLQPSHEYVANNIEHNLQKIINQRLMMKCSEIDLIFLQSPEFRDEISLLRKTPFKLTSMVGVINSCIQITCVIYVLMQYSWLWVLMSVVLSIPTFLRTVMFELDQQSDEKKNAQLRRKRDYVRDQILDEAKETKLFNLIDYFLPLYLGIETKMHSKKQRKIFKLAFINFLIELPSNITSNGIKVGLCWWTLTGKSSITDISYTQTLLSDATWQFYLFCNNIGQAYIAMSQIETFSEFLARESAIKSPASPIQLDRIIKYPQFNKEKSSDLGMQIEFINVSYRYPNKTEYTLDNVSFKISSGSHVALVGANGAGKSTLIKLMCRLLDCTLGQIKINGHDIKNYNVKQLHACFACLFQDYQRYELTAAENIGLGSVADYFRNPEWEINVDKAAKASGADKVIREKLHGDLQTQLGSQFDGGMQLSGGEWQKVALARMYMRAESTRMLILDEPTAAMDADADLATFETLKKITKDKTVLYITHRLGSVKDCHQILVLDGGKIAERGTHEQLIRANGIYKKIYHVQADSYKDTDIRAVDLE